MAISFLFSFAFHLFSPLFVRPPQTAILLFCVSLTCGWSYSLSPIQCHEPPSIVHQALYLSGLGPEIYLSLPLYNHKGFDLGHTWMVSAFPYFLQFKFEFCNKEFVIWATVSSRFCFCWLCRASPSLTAKNIINLISVLTIWWCPCVELSLVLLEEGVCYDQCILLAKLY